MTNQGIFDDLNLLPGDVIECVYSDSFLWTVGKQYTVTANGSILDDEGDNWVDITSGNPMAPKFKVVSRKKESNMPKLWKDMTDVEKGALLLAEYEGKSLQIYINDNWTTFKSDRYAQFHESSAYRPEPQRKTITRMMHCVGEQPFIAETMSNPTHIITFDMLDDSPDCSSIRMEKL